MSPTFSWPGRPRRRREFAVRFAIGAGRARVVRQLLTESFLLAAMGSVAGLAMAEGIVRMLLAVSAVQGLEVHVNLPVLAFTVAISGAAAVAFGLAPALQCNRILDPWPTLKEGTTAAGTGARFSPSRLLVVTQTALSLVLVIASGLLLRTFLNLKRSIPVSMNRSWKRTSTRRWCPETVPPWGALSSNGFRLFPAWNGRVSLSSASVAALHAFASSLSRDTYLTPTRTRMFAFSLSAPSTSAR